jgi:sulfotransferase
LIETVEFITGKTPKIIVPVRDISAILSSFEKLWRKNTGFSQWNIEQEDYFKAQTVDGRCEIWANQNQPVGMAYNRVRDAISRGYKDNLFFLEFEDLTSRPYQTMRKVYNYLELPYYQHDFDNIEQFTQEDDKVYGVFGDHIIKNKLEVVKEDFFDVLGETGCEIITNNYRWFYDAFEYKI